MRVSVSQQERTLIQILCEMDNTKRNLPPMIIAMFLVLAQSAQHKLILTLTKWRFEDI